MGRPVLSGDQLQHIETYVDAVLFLEQENVISHDQARELHGFGLLPGKDKEKLVGVPFIIIEYEFKIGRDNSNFVECAIITTHNQKYLMRDSSKGIYVQLRNLHDERKAAEHPFPTLGYPVRKGLSYQDYDYVASDGVSTQSRTYYLS